MTAELFLVCTVFAQDMNEPANFGTNEERPWNWPEDARPYWSLHCENNRWDNPPYRPCEFPTSSTSLSLSLSFSLSVCFSLSFSLSHTHTCTHARTHNNNNKKQTNKKHQPKKLNPKLDCLPSLVQ